MPLTSKSETANSSRPARSRGGKGKSVTRPSAGKKLFNLTKKPPSLNASSGPLHHSLSDSGSEVDSVEPPTLYKAPNPTFHPSPAQAYCICERGYNGSEFVVSCERCHEWFHGICVSITPQDAALATHLYCPNCARQAQRAKGTKIMKPKANFKVNPKRRLSDDIYGPLVPSANRSGPTKKKATAIPAAKPHPKTSPKAGTVRKTKPKPKVFLSSDDEADELNVLPPANPTSNPATFTKPGIVMGTLPPPLDDEDDDLDICPICDSECTCGARADSNISLMPPAPAPPVPTDSPVKSRSGKAGPIIRKGDVKAAVAPPPAGKRAKIPALLPVNHYASEVDISDWSSDEAASPVVHQTATSPTLQTNSPSRRGKRLGKKPQPPAPPPVVSAPQGAGKRLGAGKKAGKKMTHALGPPPTPPAAVPLSDSLTLESTLSEPFLSDPIDIMDSDLTDLEAEDEAAILESFEHGGEGVLSDHSSSSTFGYDYSPSNSDTEIYDEIQFEVTPDLPVESTAPVAAPPLSPQNGLAQMARSNWSSSSLDQWDYNNMLGWQSWSSNYDELSDRNSVAPDSDDDTKPIAQSVTAPVMASSTTPAASGAQPDSSSEDGYFPDVASDCMSSSDSESQSSGPPTSVGMHFLPDPPTLLSTVAALRNSRAIAIDFPAAPTPAPTPMHPTELPFTHLPPLDLSYLDALIDHAIFLPDGDILGLPHHLLEEDDDDELSDHQHQATLDSLNLDMPVRQARFRRPSFELRPQPLPRLQTALSFPSTEPPNLADMTSLASQMAWPTPAETRQLDHPSTPPPCTLGTNPSTCQQFQKRADPVPSLLETSVLMFQKRNRRLHTKRKWGDGAPELIRPSPGKKRIVTRPKSGAVAVSTAACTVKETRPVSAPHSPSPQHTPLNPPQTSLTSALARPSLVNITIDDLMDTEQLTSENGPDPSPAPAIPLSSSFASAVAMVASGGTRAAADPSRWDRIPIHSFRESRSQAGQWKSAAQTSQSINIYKSSKK
ncbi:hypothetical protein BJ085DRAFT_40903 [Dimargaris cristalligena]|uniref:PHD-type domain-containing protein n=1 Tax=Dimargaris cristalligena TaxID=215637 RepID=A0A4P9ZQ24_9FUNG|nr:hypothetical protein BJ085DRAFT_40903 [Dimargaris cristalligena]|eukprot:RKP35566.1 hypothetical protein BJ085DRAFT_40903 [Dimargaris cristalligena]